VQSTLIASVTIGHKVDVIGGFGKLNEGGRRFLYTVKLKNFSPFLQLYTTTIPFLYFQIEGGS